MDQGAVELIPREILFGNADRLAPRISPDATRLAWIAPHENVLNVWVAPLSLTGGVDWAAARVVTGDTERGIRRFYWASDGRRLLYLQDAAGDENWRLYDVDLETMLRRDLTPFDGVQARIVAIDRKFPTEILVALNRDDRKLHDVYRLDLITGELTLQAKNSGFAGWLADAQFGVRAGIQPQPDGGVVIQVRDDAEAAWRPLLTVCGEEETGSVPVAFSEDGSSLLVVSAVDAETAGLLRIDLATGARQVLTQDPVADVRDVRVQPDTRVPQIVTLAKDRAEYVVLDPDVAADLAAIRALHPGDPFFVDADETDMIWVVGFANDSGPVPFYTYDRTTRTACLLFEHRPVLNRYQLARMEPFQFTARDGLEIHGYLSFPPGVPRHNLPAVLNVHGGPAARDVWGFEPRAQWLANRGYLCVQVNYRGSTGYGRAFTKAGDREWGGKMQDDLTDAVAHIVAQGWADPERIAIFGGSYGGYAALAGAAFTPGLYRCAVDLCGPSNLKTLLETIPPYWSPGAPRLYRRVGDPRTDVEFLWARSPLSRVTGIRIPLLIAQGANDPRVKQAEAEQIVAALTAAGIEHEYMLFPDEGHGLVKPANRLRFYAAAERFLARYLGGRAEP